MNLRWEVTFQTWEVVSKRKYRDMKVMDVNAIQYDCELIKQSTEAL